MSPLIAAPISAFLLSLIVVRILASERFASRVLDIPNDRSLHVRPVPRTGGVGLMIAVGIVVAIFHSSPAAIIVPALILAALFLADDVTGLPVALRFVAQTAAAIIFLALSPRFPMPWLLLPVLTLGIVWSANLYNFMDGANGLSGGMGTFGFAAYALGAYWGGASELAMLSAVIAAATAGFLIWNFDPARIFLGDAGSIPLGFLAATIGISGWQLGAWPCWFPVLVFSPFVVDATLTLTKRVLRGERPWEAHRIHYFQRLIRAGWSHRRLALSAYVLMAVAAASALTHRAAPWPAAAMHLAFWCLIYVALAVVIDRHWQRHEMTTPCQ